MPTDDAIRLVFTQACCDFRRAKMENDEDQADLYLNVTNALEAAYPAAVDALKN